MSDPVSGERMKVVFMGSPDFAVPSLDALVESQRYRPTLVVSQPDRPRGRGQTVSPTPVRARALELHIPTITMEKATYADGVRAIAEEKPDVIVVVAFGMILKSDLLDMPARGCVNVHASLLPKYRGVSPIQAAILNGDAITGCTTMLIDEGVDTGDILLQQETPVDMMDTAGTLFDRLAHIGAELLVKTLDGMQDGSVKPKQQNGALATHTKKIKKAHGAIDWTQDAAHLARLVRAMTPWPSAYTTHNGKRLIIEEAQAQQTTRPHPPGTIVSPEPLLVVVRKRRPRNHPPAPRRPPRHDRPRIRCGPPARPWRPLRRPPLRKLIPSGSAAVCAGGSLTRMPRRGTISPCSEAGYSDAFCASITKITRSIQVLRSRAQSHDDFRNVRSDCGQRAVDCRLRHRIC